MKARDIARMGLCVALMAVCSWIAIPAAVPFTLQTFAVFLAVGFLGGKQGTMAILAYILLGTVGVPVFAGFAGGIGAILGPTGGYIIGFLAAALVVWGITRVLGDGIVKLLMAMCAGLLVLYVFGTAWFMVVYAQKVSAVSLWTALSWCVFPFVLPDAAKVALAALIARRLRKTGV